MVSSVTGAYPETKVMICQGCEDSPFSCQGTRYGAFTNSHKRVQFIKRPIVLLYKGYKSSVNYDGEPSVSKGIGSQLPSSHLLIH